MYYLLLGLTPQEYDQYLAIKILNNNLNRKG
jgi:hypothetical protein